MQTFSKFDAGLAGSSSGAISGCTSIDATRNDNGFLGCAAGKNPQASGHSSTAEAVTKLLACAGPRNVAANLVGHGDDGIIVTGTGQNANDPDKYVSLWNQGYWQPYMAQLKGHITSLSLWGCHPGTADAGADFLYNLAKVVNAPVAGPTGFLYCGPSNPDLFLEAGSVWQVATPTNRPNPIPAPTQHLEEFDMTMRLYTTVERLIEVDSERIVNVNVRRFGTSEPLTKSLDAQDSRGLIELVNLDQPFDPGGIPAALVTAEVDVTIESPEGMVEKTFLVYNDRLLQDKQVATIFYHATPGFGRALRAL